jgi:hypothetical protein
LNRQQVGETIVALATERRGGPMGGKRATDRNEQKTTRPEKNEKNKEG